nr:hypothetical protein [Streptomyces sp. RB17]
MLALAEPYLPAVRSPWPRWILESDRLSWKQAITKPTWLNLTFDMTYDGGTLAWTSRVGRLPASKMTGKVWRA